MKVVSGIAALALMAAFGCMSANATFIYLGEGAARPATATAFSSNVAAGLAEWTSGRNHEKPSMPHVSRSQEWTSLPTWFTSYRDSKRGNSSARFAAQNQAAQSQHLGAPDTSVVGAVATLSPIDIVDALVSPGAAAVPAVTLATIAADIDFADVALVDAAALAVPEPSTLGLLGLGVLLMFVVAGRSSRRRGGNRTGHDAPQLR